MKYFFSDELRNLALVCGQNLTVLDFDSVAAFTNWRGDRGSKIETMMLATSRGAHVYLKTETPIATQHARAIDCDVRGSGAYVLTAPSVHPSGARYQIFNFSTVRSVALDELATLLGLDAQNVPSVQSVPVAKPREILSDTLIAEIKAKLSIAQIVSQHSTLIPSSRDGRWWMCSCLFHKPDRHPSFWVDANRNLCGCFKPSCSAHGKPLDVINLTARLGNMSNTDSIRLLARELEPAFFGC